MRFAEFAKEYKKTFLNNLTLIYDGTHQTPNYKVSGVPFVSVEDISNLNETTKYISYEDFRNNFKTYPKYGDVLMTRIGSIGVPTIIADNIQRGYYVSLALLRPKGNLDSNYLKFIIESPRFQHELWKRTIHVAFPKKINKDDIGKCSLYYCDIEEQNKIAKILNKIDERIYTQIKIINLLYSQINYIKRHIINNASIVEKGTLDSLCDITTGKKDANEMKKNGLYKFFTCSKDDFKIDTYSFDGESLIISGNGELGLIKYYNGKFDAYQRTYVLQNFKCNPKYLMYVLQYKLPKKIEREKNVGAMPYIVLKTLTSIDIFLPNVSYQQKAVSLIEKIEKIIDNEIKLLNLFKKQKTFLLYNLFI